MTTRTVTIDGHIFVLNPLTRGQVKKLRAAGLTQSNTDPEALENVVDMAITMAEPGINPDDLPCFVAVELFRELMDLTWGGSAEKNSMPGTSGPPAAVTGDAGNVAPDQQLAAVNV